MICDAIFKDNFDLTRLYVQNDEIKADTKSSNGNLKDLRNKLQSVLNVFKDEACVIHKNEEYERWKATIHDVGLKGYSNMLCNVQRLNEYIQSKNNPSLIKKIIMFIQNVFRRIFYLEPIVIEKVPTIEIPEQVKYNANLFKDLFTFNSYDKSRARIGFVAENCPKNFTSDNFNMLELDLRKYFTFEHNGNSFLVTFDKESDTFDFWVVNGKKNTLGEPYFSVDKKGNELSSFLCIEKFRPIPVVIKDQFGIETRRDLCFTKVEKGTKEGLIFKETYQRKIYGYPRFSLKVKESCELDGFNFAIKYIK